jgi:ubiquinone/menaquinone biosynthesis C-methylase UbiE
LRLPTIDDASCDFVMTFTVLQHMVDEDVRRVVDEIKRVTRPGGFVLLGEKVAPGNETECADDRTLFLSRHRPVPVYQEWMAPFTLRSVRPRPAPPAWARNSGALMFFRHEP